MPSAPDFASKSVLAAGLSSMEREYWCGVDVQADVLETPLARLDFSYSSLSGSSRSVLKAQNVSFS